MIGTETIQECGFSGTVEAKIYKSPSYGSTVCTRNWAQDTAPPSTQVRASGLRIAETFSLGFALVNIPQGLTEFGLTIKLD